MTSSLLIDNVLQADEKIIWRGNPPTGIRILSFNLLRGGIAIVIASGVFFAGLNPANYYLHSVKLSDLISNALLIVAALWYTVALLFMDAKTRANTAYAITNKRILITSFAKLTSLDLHTIQKISYQEKSDGSGTIIFEDLEPTSSEKDARMSNFEMIPEVRQVYELIQQAQHKP